VPNKLTANVKAAIMAAFADAGIRRIIWIIDVR
jgi:hypothetical protein